MSYPVTCPECDSTNIIDTKTEGPLKVWSGGLQIEYYRQCDDCKYGWCNIFKYAGFVEEYDDDETILVDTKE